MLKSWTHKAHQPIQNWRVQNANRCIAFFTQETECHGEACGWDEFSQSAKRIDCLVCGGKGKLFSFEQQPFLSVVNWISDRFLYPAVAPGTELGDVMLGVDESELWIIRRVLESQRSYIQADDKTVRPLSISPNIVPQVGESSLVSCKLYTNTIE